jgi:hypothetical protein
MDFSTGSPAEGNASAYVVVYEDADGTGELHIKITNNDTSDRTYSYTIVYQEVWVFDSSRIGYAQRINLAGTTDATNTSTGAAVIAGGVGIAKQLYVGGLANIAGALTLQSTLTAHGVTSAGATGTGNLVFATSPTFVTPALGTPSSGNLANCTAFPAAQLTGLGTGVGTFLATPSSANLKSAITDETGSGALVFATSPTLVTPDIGTPSAGNLSNCTAFPAANLSGLGSGVATFLATPSSANLAAAVTGETGSGALVFATSPSLTTPFIGAATGTSLLVSSKVGFGAYDSANAMIKNFGTQIWARRGDDGAWATLLAGEARVVGNFIVLGPGADGGSSDGVHFRYQNGSDLLELRNGDNTAPGNLSVGSISAGSTSFGITINYLDWDNNPQSVSF